MSWLSKTIDSVVEAVSPRSGLHRKASRARLEYAERFAAKHRQDLSAGGYASAEKSRDGHSWLTSNLSPQSAIESDRPEMLKRADAAYKNHELATGHVEGRTVRVVGCGTSLDPNISAFDGVSAEQADAWNDFLRDEWDRQSERIGKGNRPLWKVQQLMHRHLERHGEWFILIGDQRDALSPTSLKVEVIHPRRIETPPGKEGDPLCRNGIQLNTQGEVAGYYIRNSHPGDNKETDDVPRFYPATFPNGLARVVHHYDELEAGMRRGIPRMQVGTKRLKNTDEYSEAEIERNFAAACHVGVITTDLSPEEASAGEVVDSQGRRVREMSPGQMLYAGEADSVSFNNPSGAPATFEPFVLWQGRQFCVGTGVPYEIAANDFRGMNYSTLRGVWNIEDATCKVLHKAHAEALVAIYRVFVTKMVTTPSSGFEVEQAAYRATPWRYWAVRVVAPAKASLDPAKEDGNELKLIEAGIRPASDFVEQKTGQVAEKVYKRVAKDRSDRRANKLEEHMPNMGRDPQPASPNMPTQAGDSNEASSEANSDGERAIA